MLAIMGRLSGNVIETLSDPAQEGMYIKGLLKKVHRPEPLSLSAQARLGAATDQNDR
jgi:hypothetical protein